VAANDSLADSVAAVQIKVDVTPVNDPPTIKTLTASPTTITATTPMFVTLTANSVADVDSAIAGVSFYVDADGSGTFDVTKDTLLGVDTTASDGWTWTVAADHLPTPGTQLMYFALAYDGQAYSTPAQAKVAASPPDLAVTMANSNVWQSAIPEPGGLESHRQERGTGYQVADWTLQFYLSTDAVYQPTDTLICSETYSSGTGNGITIARG